MKSKKGIMLSEAFGAVLTVVLVAVLVIVAIYMFSNMKTTFPLTTGVTTTNETGAYLNGTGYTLANSTVCRFANPVITQVVNATSGVIINAGNYTLTGNVLYNTTGAYLVPTAKVSYTYSWGDEQCKASDAIITQFVAYPTLVGLVGTIIFLGVVIGVLVGSFVFRRKTGI